MSVDAANAVRETVFALGELLRDVFGPIDDGRADGSEGCGARLRRLIRDCLQSGSRIARAASVFSPEIWPSLSVHAPRMCVLAV